MKKALLFIFIMCFNFELFSLYCCGSLKTEDNIYIYKEDDTIKHRPVKKKSCPKRIDEYGYSNEELVLMAQMTIAESEGETELGKRLVIDTILNRQDSDSYPSTIEEVLFQSGQFSCIKSGRFDSVKVDGNTVDLVVQEIKNRTNYDVLYFTAGGYSSYGTPLLVEGNHYFSSK